MANAWIEGENLHIVVEGKRIPADRIEVESAPEQPGILILAYYKNGKMISVYVDKDGESSDRHTADYFVKKARRHASCRGDF